MGMSSPHMPYEKYSWFGSPLMLTKGSTAMECWGGVEVVAPTVGGVGGWLITAAWSSDSVCLDSQPLSIARDTRATMMSPDTTAIARPLNRAAGSTGACLEEGSGAVHTVAPVSALRTASSNFGNARLGFPLAASKHWEEFRKYSRPGGMGALSMRSEITGCRFELARSTSLGM